MSIQQIRAAYDEEGIYVHQAYKPEIAAAALANGTFADGFQLERMTWIKPSFGWMLHRSGYATKPNQEAILRIKLKHEGFLDILRQAVKSSFDPHLHASEADWKQAVAHSDVRLQWDPDRALDGTLLKRRAIQLGLRGAMVWRYVNEFIIALEDVTPLAHAIESALHSKTALPDVPDERVYDVDEGIARRVDIW